MEIKQGSDFALCLRFNLAVSPGKPWPPSAGDAVKSNPPRAFGAFSEAREAPLRGRPKHCRVPQPGCLCGTPSLPASAASFRTPVSGRGGEAGGRGGLSAAPAQAEAAAEPHPHADSPPAHTPAVGPGLLPRGSPAGGVLPSSKPGAGAGQGGGGGLLSGLRASCPVWLLLPHV